MIWRICLGALPILIVTLCDPVVAESPLRSPEAMEALRERAASGEIAAIHELGATLQSDEDPDNDIEGRDLLIRAAEAGRWQSAYFLAQSYLFGWSDWARLDGEANFPEGLSWLRRSGEMAPPDAQAQDVYRLLGQIYSRFLVKGTMWPEIPVDEAEAVRWYRLCALELDPFCEWQLGRLLIKSPEAASEGIRWLLNAANAGHEYPMSDLARLYETGTVVEKDLEKAIIWHERSARWGMAVSGRTEFEAAARKKVAELSEQLPPETVARAIETATQFRPSEPGWH